MAEVDRDPFGRGVAAPAPRPRPAARAPPASGRRAPRPRRGRRWPCRRNADGGPDRAGRTAARRTAGPRHGDRAPAPTRSAPTEQARRCGGRRAATRSARHGQSRAPSPPGRRGRLAIIAIAVSAVASQIGWPSSVASRRASSAAGIAMSQSGRRTAMIACLASKRGRTPRRPSARALLDRSGGERQAVVEGADDDHSGRSQVPCGVRSRHAAVGGVAQAVDDFRLRWGTDRRRHGSRPAADPRRQAVPRDRRHPRSADECPGPGSPTTYARRRPRAGCGAARDRLPRRPARRWRSTRPPVSDQSAHVHP